MPPSPPKDAKKLSAYLGESSSIAATVRSLFKADKSSGTSKKRKVKESATASKKASRGSTSTQEKQKPCNSKSCSTMLTPTYFRPQGMSNVPCITKHDSDYDYNYTMQERSSL